MLGGTTMFRFLQSPYSPLEFLDLGDILSRNRKLKELNLADTIHGICATSLETFSVSVLRNPNSALEILNLRGDTGINDDLATTFVNNLTNNGKLRKLFLGDRGSLVLQISKLRSGEELF